MTATSGEASRPLFRAYPGLRKRIPFVPLADLPTPLERLDRLAPKADTEIWVKRDGLSHPVYGGNKLRKFEFYFGDILSKGARVVLTGGGLGSHHTLAVAMVARQLGILPVCSYYCQPITSEVRRNLRYSASLAVDMHLCGDYLGLVRSFAWQYVRWLLRTQRPPYFIYPGGSGTLGVLGYVNAAFEIREQLDWSSSGQPDAIFVAVGSCGTYAGLLLGARLAGLESRILGVRIIEEDVANRQKIAGLVNRTARYLHRRSPSVPLIKMHPRDVELVDGYVGTGYAHATVAALEAQDRMMSTEGLPLETTYTAKALAALLDYVSQASRERVLFIDTYTESTSLREGPHRRLPELFWPVFEPDHRTRCWCFRSLRDRSFCFKKAEQRPHNIPTAGP